MRRHTNKQSIVTYSYSISSSFHIAERLPYYHNLARNDFDKTKARLTNALTRALNASRIVEPRCESGGEMPGKRVSNQELWAEASSEHPKVS